MRRALDLRFKGARRYIQGPDMVDAAMRQLEEAGAAKGVSDLVFVFHRMTGRNLDLVLDDERLIDGRPVASLSFETGGTKRRAVLVERVEQPTARYPYDEDSLRACCRTDVPARTIVLQGASPFTPIETMVAMTKALHLAVFLGKTGQWVFGRLEAPRWPPACFHDGLTVALAQAVGTRLTKSRVSLGRETLAWIYFALKERD